jgi:hypothetical protein
MARSMFNLILGLLAYNLKRRLSYCSILFQAKAKQSSMRNSCRIRLSNTNHAIVMLRPQRQVSLSHTLRFNVTDTDYQSNFFREEDIWDDPNYPHSSSSSPWLRPSGDQNGQQSTPPTNVTSFDPDLDAPNLADFGALNLADLNSSAPTVDFPAFDSSSVWDTAYCESFTIGGSNPGLDLFRHQSEPNIDSGFVSMQTSPQRHIEPFDESVKGHDEKYGPIKDPFPSTGQPQESQRESDNALLDFDDPSLA